MPWPNYTGCKFGTAIAIGRDWKCSQCPSSMPERWAFSVSGVTNEVFGCDNAEFYNGDFVLIAEPYAEFFRECWFDTQDTAAGCTEDTPTFWNNSPTWDMELVTNNHSLRAYRGDGSIGTAEIARYKLFGTFDCLGSNVFTYASPQPAGAKYTGWPSTITVSPV